jgi:hypothetical protein
MNAITGFQTVASPALRAIMDDTQPACIRLRQIAALLDGALVTGEYERLNDHQRWSLRNLVFALHAVADQLGEPVAVERPARKWWRVWL